MGFGMLSQRCIVTGNASPLPATNRIVGTQRPTAIPSGWNPPRNRRLLARLASGPRVSSSSEDVVAATMSSKDALKTLLDLGRELPAFPVEQQTITNRVMGCTTRTYLLVQKTPQGTIEFQATSDSEITKGFIAMVSQRLNSKPASEILEFEPASLGPLWKNSSVATPSRTNGFLNFVETLKRKTRMLIQDFPSFPSLVIKADELIAEGDFATAQAQYLHPNIDEAKELARILEEKQVGVVAHFYMDPQVQGVLSAARQFWPHIHISDSLIMADTATNMVNQGCKHIAVLGVDFMAENVRAMLDKGGHEDINVFRMATEHIGCSLAEAAESPSYTAFLKSAREKAKPTLHVIYINTSLWTKAMSQTIIPTITCTSSTVVQTILQAVSQVDDLDIVYGPDTYMGRNIQEMFEKVAEMTDEEIAELHPQHNRQTIKALLDQFEYFDDGICIVHHLFGGDVCNLVREAYGDAYITAHFEVPGEMFGLAMEAKKRGMGVIGSSANILNFITDTVRAQGTNRTTDQLQFILGTESGMITSIVHQVQEILNGNPSLKDLEVEIVFPVSSSAVTTKAQTSDKTIAFPEGMDVVPGPAAGEGCSVEGGCANCPYMKMNTLDALRRIVGTIEPTSTTLLDAYRPKSYLTTVQVDGKEALLQDVGCAPILEMRHLQKTGELSQNLIDSVLTPAGA